MATLRDSLLPLVDTLRNIPVTFGLRRFSVTIRRRTWSTLVQGEGTATDTNIALIPAPKVRDITSRDLTELEAEMMAASSNKIVGNMYRITGITPRYKTAAGVIGGYLAEQIRLWPNTDTGAIQNLVALVGDDGYLRECEQVTFAQDRSFGYSMIAKEIDRPRSYIQSIAITPATATVASATQQTQQLTSTGTFAGGATSIMTVLTAWSTSNVAVATVDVYGKVTAVAAGSAVITGLCLGQTSTATITVT